ncbi:putative MFS-type transporter [Lachnellula arida]|uniref:Putative MFS-type transporter n=1 Tax=Lachnellula arida TaxID=1316785 RepID=A0A8T9B341_9HELO|nr:putative MFS-type transporter [Lachnellula arida]
MAAVPWNWPLSWRIIILLNISFYNMLGNVFAAGVPPLFSLLIEEFHCTTDEASRLPIYALLMLGVANLWALPAVEYVGKRHAILISMVVFLASSIWAATAQSYNSLLGSRFLGGFSAGVIEALGPFIVSECFPEEQLASAMVVYVGFLAAGSSVGPIVAGAIASGLDSWRWFFGILSIAIGVNLITCFLMLPDTTHIIDDFWEENLVHMIDHSSDELLDPNFIKKPSNETEFDNESNGFFNSQTGQTQQSLKSLWIERSFSLRIDSPRPKENPFKLLVRPFPLLLAPEVLVTALIFGLNIGWTAVTATVVSNIYEMPPMQWAPWQLGLINFGPLLGLLIGLPVGGAAADFLSSRAMKTANGLHDPRSRLPALVLGALISPAGCLVIGFALQEQLHFMATAVGWAMLTFGLTSSANVLLTYCVDCERSRAGEIGVLVNVVKNALAFGVSFASMDWYLKDGGEAMYGTMAGIMWATYLLVVPLYFFSSEARKFSARLL